MSPIATGFLLIVLAAVMNGAFAMPMKFMRQWRWENAWLSWTVLSLWVFPLILLWLTVPYPQRAYAATPWSSLAWMGAMGALWGVGTLMIGISFDLVGIAVGAAVALGCAAGMGTVLPLLRSDAPALNGKTVWVLALGVTMVLAGVSICGFAGHLREKHQGVAGAPAKHSLRGFVIASLGGIFTAAFNLAFVSGATISASVAQQHPATQASGIAIWVPILLAG